MEYNYFTPKTHIPAASSGLETPRHEFGNEICYGWNIFLQYGSLVREVGIVKAAKYIVKHFVIMTYLHRSDTF